MSKVVINDTSLTAIGDAIRQKTGSPDLLLPSEMPAAIESIPSGGGGGGGGEIKVLTYIPKVTKTDLDKETGQYIGIDIRPYISDINNIVAIFFRGNPNNKYDTATFIKDVCPVFPNYQKLTTSPGNILGVSKPVHLFKAMSTNWTNNDNLPKPIEENYYGDSYIAINPENGGVYGVWKIDGPGTMTLHTKNQNYLNTYFERVDIVYKGA